MGDANYQFFSVDDEVTSLTPLMLWVDNNKDLQVVNVRRILKKFLSQARVIGDHDSLLQSP